MFGCGSGPSLARCEVGSIPLPTSYRHADVVYARDAVAKDLTVVLQDRPGELARLGEASVNIEFAYTTFGGVKLVVATDDMDSARAALA